MKRGTFILVTLLTFTLFATMVVSGQEDPDLSPFDATVTISNAPPTILNFIAVIENPDDINGITPNGEIQGAQGGVVPVRFRFVAEDPNGVDDLPGLTGPAIVEGTNVIVTFTEPANDATSGTNILNAVGGNCAAVSCVGNSDCTDQTAGTNEKEYVCDIDMNYFDPSSPNGGAVAADRWTISATIFDITAINSDTKSSGDVGFTTLADNYILYRDITGISTSGSINWASLDINLADQPADASLVFDNVGNTVVADESLTARNLVEDTVPANFIDAAAFSTGSLIGGADSGACDAPGGGGSGTGGITLIDNIGVIVSIPVTFSGDGTDTTTVFFCNWDILSPTHITGPVAPFYVSNFANTNRWDITFNS